MVLFVDTYKTTRSQKVKADWTMFGVTSSAHLLNLAYFLQHKRRDRQEIYNFS
jgi:hypothetical protein